MTPGFLGFRMDSVMLSSEVFPFQAPLKMRETPLQKRRNSYWNYERSGICFQGLIENSTRKSCYVMFDPPGDNALLQWHIPVVPQDLSSSLQCSNSGHWSLVNTLRLCQLCLCPVLHSASKRDPKGTFVPFVWDAGCISPFHPGRMRSEWSQKRVSLVMLVIMRSCYWTWHTVVASLLRHIWSGSLHFISFYQTPTQTNHQNDYNSQNQWLKQLQHLPRDCCSKWMGQGRGVCAPTIWVFLLIPHDPCHKAKY